MCLYSHFKWLKDIYFKYNETHKSPVGCHAVECNKQS